MKYIITESQFNRNLEYLKEPMFKYWDMNGGKDLKMVRNLFSVPPAASTLIEDWLLEWMGGEEEVLKMLGKYQGRNLNAQAGTYDFNFYLDNLKIYTHGGVEVYFDAIVDGDGNVTIPKEDGSIIDNIYDAYNDKDEDIGWQVEDEIRDTVIESLDEIIDIEFSINIDRVIVTERGTY
jgi:hypothetical protein